LPLIKERLDQWMAETGMTVSDLAKKSGVKKSWMYDILSQRREPRVFKIFYVLLKEGVLTMEDLDDLYKSKEKR